MTDAELEQLLNDIESDRVERKEALGDRGAIRQAICAFANDMPHHGCPGVVFVGIRDDAPIRFTWFNDRIEIQNPGGPFGQVTRLNFGQPGITDYRNPNIAEALRNLGFVQRFGVGIQIARQAILDNGNPPLEFDVQENHVLAVIRRRP